MVSATPKTAAPKDDADNVQHSRMDPPTEDSAPRVLSSEKLARESFTAVRSSYRQQAAEYLDMGPVWMCVPCQLAPRAPRPRSPLPHPMADPSAHTGSRHLCCFRHSPSSQSRTTSCASSFRLHSSRHSSHCSRRWTSTGTTTSSRRQNATALTSRGRLGHHTHPPCRPGVPRPREDARRAPRRLRPFSHAHVTCCCCCCRPCKAFWKFQLVVAVHTRV